jgi:hypothetical protein
MVPQMSDEAASVCLTMRWRTMAEPDYFHVKSDRPLSGGPVVMQRHRHASALVGHLAMGYANKSDGFLCQARRKAQR